MIIEKLNHLEEALANLLEQYKNKPVFKGLLTAYMRQIQELESAIVEVYNISLDNAFGATLDGYGSIVGEPRLGRTDAEYRLAIKARIHINISSGTPEDIYKAMVDFDDRVYHITQYQKAAFILRVIDAVGTDPSPTDYWKLLNDVKIAGVKAYLHFSLVDDSNTFELSSSDSVEYDVLKGLSDDSQITGGTCSQIIDGDYTVEELGPTYVITRIAEFLTTRLDEYLIAR